MTSRISLIFWLKHLSTFMLFGVVNTIEFPLYNIEFHNCNLSTQGTEGQVVNAVVDQTGNVLNYSTNTAQGNIFEFLKLLN